MLLDEIKDIKSSREDLKKFGLTLGIFFAFIGAICIWRSKSSYPYWIGLSVFFLFFSFVAPQILKPIQKAWMTLALLMGWVMTRVLLGVVFYLVITPISLISKIAGKKFLSVENTADQSHWVIRKPLNRTKEDYEKQY